MKNLNQTITNTKLLLCLLVAVSIAVGITHSPALNSRVISFDDNEYFVNNPLVQTPSPNSAKRFFTEVLNPSTVPGYYQPLTMLSLMLDRAAGAGPDNLTPLRRTSLALHIANTALVAVFLYILFGRPCIAAAVALLFGLHPMTVENIPWLGERKTLLAMFFSLWSLILYVRYTRKKDYKLYLACTLTYILALLSKPTSTPLPILMLLLDYWPLNRLSWRALLEKLPLLAIAAAAAVITYLSQANTAAITLPTRYGPERIPLTICHNIVFYLHKTVRPINLSSHYSFPDPFTLSNPAVTTALIGTAVILAIITFSLRFTRALFTGLLFFFLALLPTMQIVGFSTVIAADKFAYLPSIGLLIILASFLAWLSDIRFTKTIAIILTHLILFAAFAEAKAARSYLAYWTDTQTLFEYFLTLDPHAPMLHNHLAAHFESRGELDKAIHHHRCAMIVMPDYAESHYNLANLLAARGNLAEAEESYYTALSIDPDYPQAHNNLARLLAQRGEFDRALNHLNEALRTRPYMLEARQGRAYIFLQQNKIQQAIKEYEWILQAAPDNTEAKKALEQAKSKIVENHE